MDYIALHTFNRTLETIVMSQPSNWPIPKGSIRFVLPRPTVNQLKNHPISKDFYPLAVGFYQNAAGHRMSRTKHDDLLLIYCVKGTGSLRIGKLEQQVQAGDLVILPKEIIHAYQASNENPWSIYWVHCDGDLLNEYTKLMGKENQKPIQPIGLHPRLVADFESLLDLRKSTQLFVSFMHASSLLRQIITHAALIISQQRHHYEQSFNMDAIQTFMLTRLHETLDIDTLANQANLSKFHFIKRYKQLTGSTPINDFIRMKIERACHLLDITDQRISEIAWTLGYEDAYYFSRSFSKVMGISPSQYRNIRLGRATYKD